jgi:hypothetical protein
LPSTTSARRTGLVTSVWIAPEPISPESVSTGVSTAIMIIRKFTAYNPASTSVFQISLNDPTSPSLGPGMPCSPFKIPSCTK